MYRLAKKLRTFEDLFSGQSKKYDIGKLPLYRKVDGRAVAGARIGLAGFVLIVMWVTVTRLPRGSTIVLQLYYRTVSAAAVPLVWIALVRDVVSTLAVRGVDSCSDSVVCSCCASCATSSIQAS